MQKANIHGQEIEYKVLEENIIQLSARDFVRICSSCGRADGTIYGLQFQIDRLKVAAKAYMAQVSVIETVEKDGCFERNTISE